MALLSPGDTAPSISATSASIPWDDLVELISAGQVIPVIGDAALTVRDDRGKWRPLCEVLADRLAKETQVDVAPGTSLREVAARVLRSKPSSVAKSKFRKIHDDLLRRLSNDDIGSTLKAICEITDFPVMLTTSTTALIEKTLESARKGPPTVVLLGEGEANDLPKQFLPSVNGTLVYLFGRVSNSLKFPLTDEDILESLRRLYEERPAELLDQLKDRNLLFIGVCFPDWLTRMFIRALRKERLSDDHKTLKALADGAMQEEAKLVLFLEGLGPNMCVYHGELANFVEELHTRWKRQAPSPQRVSLLSPLSGTDPVVFLSYSSSDRAVAERVAGLFREQGLDVWYDGSHLQSGAHYETEIQKGIARCVFFVPLISVSTENSGEGFFRKEWGWAIDRSRRFTGTNRRFIVPLVVDELDVRRLKNTPPEFQATTIQLAPSGHVPEDLLVQLVRELRELRVGGGGA